MAIKAKLQRLGKIRTAQYRVVVANARTHRSGTVIESLGIYHSKEEPSIIKIDSKHVQYRLGVGARPTRLVLALPKVAGDRQKLKGLEDTESILKVTESEPTKLELFNKALEEVNNGPSVETTTAKHCEAKEAAKAAKETGEAVRAAKAGAAEPKTSEGAEQ